VKAIYMLGWAIAFFVAAIIVALLGLAEAATTFAVIAKVLFWVFLVGFVFSLVMHFSRSRA
jgi:uncharacterized membrane protein YtjA (UPF0391 family)